MDVSGSARCCQTSPMDRRIRVVDEWRGFCPSCEGDGRLVLTEHGPRWTARELFGRTWTPRQDFMVHCRTCGTALRVPHTELAAAASRPKPEAPVRAGGEGSVPSPRTRPATGAVPTPRAAVDAAAPKADAAAPKAGASH